jgi:hypothetical protein
MMPVMEQRHDDIRLHLQPGHQVSPERGPGVLPGWPLGAVAAVNDACLARGVELRLSR